MDTTQPGRVQKTKIKRNNKNNNLNHMKVTRTITSSSHVLVKAQQ
jgi:hypothetical protein